MRSDDDTTLGGPGTTPDNAAANEDPGQSAQSGAADPMNAPSSASPFGAPETPAAPPTTPWQPMQPPAWTPPTGPSPWQPPAWTPPAGPSPWQPLPPQQSLPPSWPPAPLQQPQTGWSAQPGWPPSQSPQGYGGSIPPMGDVTRRRPSRLPQIVAVIAACLIAFSGGLITDHIGFPATSACAAASAAPQASGTSAPVPTCVAAPNASLKDATLYNEALAIVKQYYVGRATITDQQLVAGSIKGMVDGLGDTGHSTYLTPQEYAAWQQSLSANVAGIGVIMSSNNGIFTIDRIILGSPAEAAGVKAGDVIVAVDGASTTNMTFDQMGTKIRGNAGTKVTMTVLHAGSSTPVDITITRANIVVSLSDWSMIPGTHIADITLTEFSQGAADQLQANITAATKAGATSIILDLRGNPGGYASEALDVASEFLPSGVVYITQDASGKNTEERVNPNRTHNAMPVVVLVDHNSASSAEIVAGALQDQGRAKIVGVPTYGTGTVLQEFPLSDGSVIILGTEWWLTPNGHRIFGIGIKPDETVQMPSGVYPTYPTDITPLSSSQFAGSKDTQLLAAVKDLSN